MISRRRTEVIALATSDLVVDQLLDLLGRDDAVPLLAMLVASWFITSPIRRRVWTICAFVSSVGIIFGIPYAFPVGFLVYAGMRANKVEGPVPGSRAARAMEARGEAASSKAASSTDDDGPDTDDDAPDTDDDDA